MNLSGILTLIVASLFGLLPILLLIGRRARTRRVRSAVDSEPTVRTGEAAPPPRQLEDSRLARIIESPTVEAEQLSLGAALPADSAVFSTALPSLQAREDQRAAFASPAPGRLPWEQRPGSRVSQSSEMGDRWTYRTTRASRRLAHLTELQRAVVLAEILGPPAGLLEGDR